MGIYSNVPGTCSIMAFYTIKDMYNNGQYHMIVTEHYERCGNGIIETVDTYV